MPPPQRGTPVLSPLSRISKKKRRQQDELNANKAPTVSDELCHACMRYAAEIDCEKCQTIKKLIAAGADVNFKKVVGEWSPIRKSSRFSLLLSRSLCSESVVISFQIT